MTARSKSVAPVGEPEFTGFPEQGFRFLRQLKLNNDRDWFRERKPDYERYVQRPMEALVLAAARECRHRGVPLHAKDKNPVMRVYRDIRFSKNKQPFKTHVAAELRRSFGDSTCMLYIHLSPAESLLAAGVWQPERPLLHAWRTIIAERPARFEKVCSGLARKGVELSNEQSLSNMPRGFLNYAAEPFAPWLRLTSFVAVSNLERSQCTSAGLLETVVDFAIAVKPLLEFGWDAEQAQATGPGKKRLTQDDLW